MKLLVGAIAYLSVVTAFVLAAFSGLSLIEARQPDQATVALAPADQEAGSLVRAADQAKADDDRVPVWIVPTAKYVYTPVPVDQKANSTSAISKEARAAMARARDGSRADGRMAIEQALGERRADDGRALGFARSRDNDPFFRD